MGPSKAAEATERRNRYPRPIRVATWLVQLLLASFFIMSGVSKLTAAPEMVALFDAVGIGQWFRYLTGAAEVSGAVLLLIPRVSAVGALVLATVMTGAVLSHLFLIGGNPALPLTLLAFAAAVALARKRQLELLTSGRLTGQ